MSARESQTRKAHTLLLVISVILLLSIAKRWPFLIFSNGKSMAGGCRFGYKRVQTHSTESLSITATMREAALLEEMSVKIETSQTKTVGYTYECLFRYASTAVQAKCALL